jgi:enamine deaminase RidA (YjgF/YER057c/UK114 family)
MARTITNPETLHDPIPLGYSHVVGAAGQTIFVAGQYGSDGGGGVVSDDFAAQAEQAFANLELALAAVGAGVEDVVRVGTYIVDHDVEKLGVVGGLLARTWGTELPAQTMIGVASLALPGMLFEIDAVAVLRRDRAA